MKEHEQLKEICDKIGYKKNINSKGIYYTDGLFLLECEGYIKIVNVREIIFTPEFMEKLSWYLGAISIEEYKELGGNIVNNLDNPVLYLYNLLGLGKQENN